VGGDCVVGLVGDDGGLFCVTDSWRESAIGLDVTGFIM
jgi:hypothetical protein